MKHATNIKLIFTAAAFLLSQHVATAINPHSVTDIFKEISVHLKSGDADKLAAHFSATLELRILTDGKTCSDKQASPIIKNFFSQYKPVNFSMLHVGSKATKYYGIGLLTAGSERFRVTIFLLISDSDSYTIQQLCIDHED